MAYTKSLICCVIVKDRKPLSNNDIKVDRKLKRKTLKVGKYIFLCENFLVQSIFLFSFTVVFSSLIISLNLFSSNKLEKY
jgi:hypothetical protein